LGGGAKPSGSKVKIMDGDRELTTGLLSKDASFRLIVSGDIGVNERDRAADKVNSTRKSLLSTTPPTWKR